MILKLELPYIDRLVEGGKIERWYKNEGDEVNYGDELADIEIQIKLWTAKDLSEKIKNVTGIRNLEEEDAKIIKDRSRSLIFHIQIISSDRGILSKICAKEGEYRDVGGILALLTTDRNELLDESEDVLNQASKFRVVTNTIQSG